MLHQSAALPSGLSVVAGIAVGTASTTADDLVQHARIAVTAAEQAGRATQVFRPEMREGIVRRARTARLLSAAVDRDEFELHYQPVIDVRSGTRVSVEALVRWRHHGRLHPPAEWIPIAEQIGLMPAIGLAVLQIAIRDQQQIGLSGRGECLAPAADRSPVSGECACRAGAIAHRAPLFSR